jgi:hypothetical protein
MFNIDELRRQIEAMLRDFPDLIEDETLRLDMLDGQTDLREALTGLADKMHDTLSMMAALTQRIATMTERRGRFSRRADFLRALMLKVLQSADLRKIELAEATLSQRAGQPKIVGEVDVNTLPAEFVRVTTEPNRVAIREALMAHREIPGLSLSNAEPGLIIKVK